MKRFKTVPKTSTGGFATLSLMIMAGVVAIGAFATIAIVASSQRWTSTGDNKIALELVREKVLGVLSDEAAWSVMKPINASMVCLVAHNCTNQYPAGVAEPPVPAYGQSNVKLQSTVGAGSWTYDPVGDPTAGFDLKGVPCTGFNPTLGSDQCPVRVEVKWLPSCQNPVNPGNCFVPEEWVTIAVLYSPGTALKTHGLASMNTATLNISKPRLALNNSISGLRCTAPDVNETYVGSAPDSDGSPHVVQGKIVEAGGCVSLTAFQPTPTPTPTPAPTPPPPPPPPPGFHCDVASATLHVMCNSPYNGSLGNLSEIDCLSTCEANHFTCCMWHTESHDSSKCQGGNGPQLYVGGCSYCYAFTCH